MKDVLLGEYRTVYVDVYSTEYILSVYSKCCKILNQVDDLHINGCRIWRAVRPQTRLCTASEAGFNLPQQGPTMWWEPQDHTHGTLCRKSMHAQVSEEGSFWKLLDPQIHLQYAFTICNWVILCSLFFFYIEERLYQI